jgi:hypothetical protein
MASQLKHTVKPSGGDFTTLSAAIAHLIDAHSDFISADLYGSIEIDGDWSGGADSTAVTITGLTLDATHYLEIYTTGIARHRGVLSSLYYRLASAGNNITLLDSEIGYVYISGLHIANTTGSPSFGMLTATSGGMGYDGPFTPVVCAGGMVVTCTGTAFNYSVHYGLLHV